jgi:putative exosortase-associated protein (TIGR04073 family)
MITFDEKGDFMRISVLVLSLLIAAGFAGRATAEENQRAEVVMEKMAFKFVRGVTNAATCIVELPKQIYLTPRNRGASGYATGPVKGLGMTLYRAFAGITETALFLVPQPGYYDSMINPDFVWKGWEENRPEPSRPKEGEPAEGSDGSKEK